MPHPPDRIDPMSPTSSELDPSSIARLLDYLPMATMILRIHADQAVDHFTIVSVNPPAARALGRSASQLRNEDLETIFPEFPTSALAARVRALPTQPIELGELRRGEGEDEHVHRIRATLMSPETVLVTYDDITELTRTQAQLIQCGKLAAIGELAGALAHEVNNPLMAILSSAEFLREDLTESLRPEHREDLQTILSAGHQASEMTRQLLGFARGSGVRRSTRDLREIVTKTLDFVGDQLTKISNARVELDLPEALVVHGNANQLQQVVTNLLINAAQAIGDRTAWIRVRGRSIDSGIELDVIDDGPGIPNHVIDRVFAPFFTTKSTGEGTGLGLSVSKSIVEEHGGQLNVQNAPGHGAHFTVRLPRRLEN